MPKPSIEPIPQREFLLRLRAAIDNARAYPTEANISRAQKLAYSQPRAMRSSHVSHNLGASRWEWLGEHGVTFIGESVEICGNAARKMTITQEVKK